MKAESNLIYRFQSLSLRIKLILSMSFVILLLGLLSTNYINSRQSIGLTKNLQNMGILIAQNLAANAANPILKKDIMTLHELAANIKKIQKDIAYVYITGPKGSVVVHTFEEGFPVALKGINSPLASHPYSVQLLDTELGYIRDVAVKIYDRLGEVHIGISEGRTRQIVSSTRNTLLGLTLGAVLLGVMLISYIVDRLLKPMDDLNKGAEAIGSGNLDYRIEVKRQDEIGRFSSAFNKMADRLKTDIVGREKAERALMFMKFSIDHTADAAFWMGDDARFIYVNDAACASLGYSREELMTMSVRDIDPCYSQEAWPEQWEVIKKRKSFSFESRHRTKAGREFPVEITVNYLSYEGREFNCAFARDITLRKDFEQDLLKAHERLLAVLDSMDAMVYVSDIKTHEVLFANHMVKKTFGEVEGKVCWQVLHKGQSKPCEFCTNRYITDKEGKPAGIYSWEFQNTLNGCWYYIRDRAIYWIDGRLARIEIAIDVTERKEAENELNNRMRLAELVAEVGIAFTKEQPLYNTLQGCTDAITQYVDALFTRIWVFNESENVLELRASSGLYTHIDGFHSRIPYGKFKIGMIAKERLPHLTNHVIGDEKVHDQQWAKKEGIVAFAGHPLIVEGKLVGVMALFSRSHLTDITLKALSSVADHISLGIEQKKADEQLKASIKEKDLLLQEIHHRVKNNMTVIYSLLLLQSRKIEDEKYKKMFSESLNQIKTMALIHEKLYRSEDFGQIKFDGYVKDIAQNTFNSYGMDHRIALKQDIHSITLGIDSAIPCGLIVNELISNALKHAFPGSMVGEIVISLHELTGPEAWGGDEKREPSDGNGRLIEIIVRDNGVGIANEMDFNNPESLGLNLVHSLVKQIQGNIELQRNGGTWIKVSLRTKM